MANIDLKSCTFCGGEAFVQKSRIDGIVRFFISVVCRVCFAQTGNYTKEAYAIEAWNRRGDDGKAD
ncbi:MAG: Lar family restriction alleviation protein [Candidatus Faecousia sp.]|uniref:Lar family restriction alleviation protein n=1 Tax=Faecousia sp. TaxID=2952921 RepID=UPI002A86FAF0|nr:Lar family restriction alleviation protein [Candidatus Faecousia sp.]